MSYEKQQSDLEALWQDALSDEDDQTIFDDNGSSDEYVPDSNDDSSDEELPIQKRVKVATSNAISLEKKDREMGTDQISANISCSSNMYASEVTNSNSSAVGTIRHVGDQVMDTIERVIQKYTEDSSENEGAYHGEDERPDRQNLLWNVVTGLNLRQLTFSEPNCGIDTRLYGDYYDKSPFDFYNLFLSDDIINLMVTETNKYAAQSKAKEHAPKARIQNWYDTDASEIKKFIGILFWMGLAQYPTIEYYWSQSIIYENKIRTIMSRNRFQILLKMWHFHNNEDLTNDRLQKISPLLKQIIQNFQKYYTPKEAICIDKTLVPFRGRLSFKQFIKNKRHKFGIKLYKLCVEKGYTYNLTIYCGQDKVEGQSSSENEVLTLANNLLNKGRTIYTDNYYTSISLAHSLLDKETHLVGTLRANRKLNPTDVTRKELKKGETVAAESNTGIVIQKWKDKRDVLTLSTKHTSELVKVSSGRKETEKPSAIVDYNKHKAFIDLSDQMKAYATSLRRGVKWYRKLAIELLIGTCLVNAFVLHQEVTNDKMNITKFKELVTLELLQIQNRGQLPNEPLSPQHVLEDIGRSGRGRCVVCYKNMSDESGPAHAQKHAKFTKFRCNVCQKNYCLSCFFSVHQCSK